MYPLHKLQVYGQALDLASACAFVARAIPDIDLRSQLLRAARSVAANIAEGAGSETQAAFARYVAIALASAKEAECHVRLARDAGMITQADATALDQKLINLAPRLVRLLAALRKNAAGRAVNKSRPAPP